MKIELGDDVKDSISGFRGKAVSFHDYLNGCRRITIQPMVNKEGKLPETQTFDEPQLEVTRSNKAKGNIELGGPSKYEDKGR